MLEFLHHLLAEARERGDPGLVLEFYNPPPRDDFLESYEALPRYDEPPRLTVFATRVDVARELGFGGAEAIGLLKDLEADGYIYLDYGGSGPYVDAGEVILSFSEKGHAAIKALSDPNEALLEKLDAIAGAIRELGDITLDEKKPAIEAIEELKRFVGALPSESSTELLRRLPGVFGLGGR
jgi:hypothetical protein